MCFFKAILFLLFFISLRKCYTLLKDETSVECSIDDKSFWLLYNWQFGNATIINISLLSRKYSVFIEKYLSTMFYQLLTEKMYYRTFTISAHKICADPMNETFQDISFTHKNFFNASLFSPFKDTIRLRRKLRYSADLDDVYILITWDIEDFLTFLKKMAFTVVKNPRGIYLIMFISPKVDQKTEGKVEYLFRVLWEDYGVLNVKAKFLCAPDYPDVYMYDPFASKNGSWGILRKFLIIEALTHSIKYRNTLWNLKGSAIPVSIFIRKPTVISHLPKAIQENKIYEILSKSKGYGGVDGTVLAYLSDILNFEPLILNPPPGNVWGYKLNETFVGSLGQVVHRNVAISFNARFIAVYDTDDIEFTTPTSNDLLCFLVPKAQKIPQWLSTFRCFALPTWLSMAGLCLLLSIFLYVVKQVDSVRSEFNKYRRVTLTDIIFEVFASLVSVPFRLAFCHSHRILMLTCMFFNVIMTGTFQGALYNSYTTTSYYPDINTIEEFDESGLSIGTTSPSLITIFGTDPNPLMRKLKDKIKLLNTTESNSIAKVAYGRNIATFERKNDAILILKSQYTSSDGHELLHLTKTCPWSYYLSYIVPKGSPYLPIFNILILRFREAGLIDKWHKDTVNAFILESRVQSIQDDDAKPFTLDDMQAAFYLIHFGLTLATIVFIFEICIYRFQHLCK